MSPFLCRFFLLLLPGTFFLSFSPAALSSPADQWQNLITQQRQREQALEETTRRQQNVHLDSPGTKPEPVAADSVASAAPSCFPIQSVVLRGEREERFRFALQQALEQLHFQAGDCFDAQSIDRLIENIRNTLIRTGYTTTRILAGSQNLHKGELALTVVAGKIHQFRFTQKPQDNWHVHGVHARSNVFPGAAGAVLNLHDLEQGLENLRRVPTVDAGLRIVPSAVANESDVLVDWSQRVPPYRIAVHLDDSGSRATGKYLANFTVSADNPLGLSDLLYASAQREIGGKRTRLRDASGNRKTSNTRSYALHYSVPWGNWLFSARLNGYRYHQAVAGYHQNYDYNGRNKARELGIKRLLHRDTHRKTYLRWGVWQRILQRYIDDAELEVQKSRTAGWRLGLEHKEYLGRSTWEFGIEHQRGTGMLGSLAAPGEAFDEARGHMKIWTADVSVYWPFALVGQNLNYDGTLHLQWPGTPLMPQDRLSIGGRYSVRGFSGEKSLIGERGWYFRNTLGWEYQPGQQFYLGLDVGRVSGPSSKYLLGKNLTGGVVGIKGKFKAGGALQYDFFAGKPIAQPNGFSADPITLGFQLDYGF